VEVKERKMPQEDRIFLEMKPAVSGDLGGHMYLVKRSVTVDENGTVLSNNYDPVNDRVIRGAFGFNLGASEGALSQSLDLYGGR
jgi:hypothetical protein